MKTLLATALLLLASTAHACVNEVGTDRSGRRFASSWYLGETLT